MGADAPRFARRSVTGAGTCFAPPFTMRTKLLVCGALLAALPAAGNDGGLRLSVTPEMAMEPAHVVVRALIEPDADNRLFSISADSGDYYRSSEMELDGVNAARASEFRYRDLPAGVYEVRAVLIGRNGQERASVRRTVTVVR